MQQIQVYTEDAKLTVDEFVLRHPHPFIVHSGGALKGVDRKQTRGLTVDRIVIEGRPKSRIGDSFVAGELVSRDSENIITIGLSSTCDVVIDDQSLSKQHAWFERTTNGTWRVWDNDSLAGTQVNDAPIKSGEPKLVGNGDKITFGYVEVTFLTPEAFHRLLRGLL